MREMVKEENYLRIDLSNYYTAYQTKYKFNTDLFYKGICEKLNIYLGRYSRERFYIDPLTFQEKPEYYLRTMLERRFMDEKIPPLFMFLDNVDIRPKSNHFEALAACNILLQECKIRVIFAGRSWLGDHVRLGISTTFHDSFDNVLDLETLSLKKVLLKRFESVTCPETPIPFDDETIAFLEAFSNSNLRTALKYSSELLNNSPDELVESPVGKFEAISLLYRLKYIPKIYEKGRIEDQHPPGLKALQYFRNYRHYDRKYFYKLNTQFGFSEDILTKMHELAIEYKLFNATKIGKQETPNGKEIEALRLIGNSRGGTLFELIDQGFMYDLYKEYDAPKIADKKMIASGYKKDPWGGRISSEPIVKFFDD